MNHRSAPAVRYSASLDQVPHPAIQYHPTLIPTPPNNTTNTFSGIAEQPEETLLPTLSANPSTDTAIVASANPGDLTLEPALTSTSDSLDRSHTPGPSAVAIAKRSVHFAKMDNSADNNTKNMYHTKRRQKAYNLYGKTRPDIDAAVAKEAHDRGLAPQHRMPLLNKARQDAFNELMDEQKRPWIEKAEVANSKQHDFGDVG
jgi:hypothetical protein